MSDLMLYGVLRMPYEMTMGSELSRYQFYQRVQEAADRLEKAERRLAEIDAASTSTASEAGELPPLPKAAAWQHTMDNTEGIKGNEPHVVLSFGKRNPFGKAGIDYSKSFPVTADPLFTADQMRDYARAALASIRTASDTRTAALQEAARLCDAADKSEHPADLADRIRALAAGEAECDAARRAPPASQHEQTMLLTDPPYGKPDLYARLHQSMTSEIAMAREQSKVPEWFQAARGLLDWLEHKEGTASTDAPAGPACQGGNTQPVSVESARPAEVDVEAERKLFFAHFDTTSTACDRWEGWLAKARTQADAGQADTERLARPEPTGRQVADGVKALLQCCESELGDYSPKLMDGYEADVRRVYAAMTAAATPAPSCPAGSAREFSVWLAGRAGADVWKDESQEWMAFGGNRIAKSFLTKLQDDAERFRRAIAAEDNAETLYAAVMNNAPDGNAIRAEFDASTTKPENT